MRHHGLKFIDLFCGIGGFHYAFQSAGAHCVWASDYDKNARATYQANHNMEPWGDIWASKFIPEGYDKPLEPNQIPHHDILCAGFPCQPFSIAGVSKKLSLGRKHGFEDEKQGNLFFRLAAIIGHYKPKAFVLENVKNLRSHDKGNTFLVIYNTLRSMGYHLHTQIVDARHYVPQHRERIFIVGFLEPLPFEFPTPGPAHAMREARLPVLEDILEQNPSKEWTLTDNLWSYLQAYAKKHKDAGHGFGFDLVGPDAVARTLSARYYKDGSEILIRQKGKNPRKLSIDECRKLMGYPESFKPAKSKTQAYKQFGNSVVVPVVESIAHQVVKTLKTYEMVDGEARKR